MEQIKQNKKNKYSKTAVIGFVLAIIGFIYALSPWLAYYFQIWLPPFSIRTIFRFADKFFLGHLFLIVLNIIGMIICQKRNLKGTQFAILGLVISLFFSIPIVVVYIFIGALIESGI